MTITMLGDIELRPIALEEFPQFYRCMVAGFGLDAHASDCEMHARVFEPARSMAAIHGGRIVATSALAGRQLAIPGAIVPVAAGMMGSVAPTHRRRGLFTAIRRRQFLELYDAGAEVIAVNRPAEGAIYHRFGYGPATRQSFLTGDTQRMKLRAKSEPHFRLIGLSVPEATNAMIDLYSALWPGRVGWLERAGGWWDLRFYDPAHRRDTATERRVLLCEDAAGAPAAYAVYSIRYDWELDPNNEVDVLEIAARCPASYLAVCRFLLDLDLVRRFRWQFASDDEPLLYLLTDPRSVRLTARDGLWLRLVDLPRALAARRYATDIDLVLEVHDDFCTWNEGRWRLTAGPAGATCERTRASAELETTAVELATVFLGATSLAALERSGRVHEHTPGALIAASCAFLHDPPPSCPEDF